MRRSGAHSAGGALGPRISSLQSWGSQFWSQLSPDVGVSQRSNLARLRLMLLTAAPSNPLATNC